MAVIMMFVCPAMQIRDLVKLIHGRKEGVDKLVVLFGDSHPEGPQPPKAQIKKKILEISSRCKHEDGYGTVRVLVNKDVLQSLNIENVSQKDIKYLV
jgi:hypothetical protein